MYYRVTAEGKGIYEYIESLGAEDINRIHKPDGSWLHKAGLDHPDSVSYWTELGWKMYNDCGLRNWHSEVVKGIDKVETISVLPGEIEYQDEFQVLVRTKH